MENTFDRIVEILRAQCDLDESVSITMDTPLRTSTWTPWTW